MSSLATAARVGLDTLRANPLRSLLSTLGVVVGVASLVAVLAVGDGMEEWGLRNIAAEGFQSVVVRPMDGERVDGVFIAREPTVHLAARDAAELEASLPAGTTVRMQAAGAALVSSGSGRPRGARLAGTLPSAPAAGEKAAAVAHGRPLTADDARTGARVAVLSAALADSLAAPRAGATLVGTELAFASGGPAHRVVGIAPAAGDDAPRGNLVMVPVDAVRELAAAGAVRAPASIEVRARSVDDVDDVLAAAQAWASRRWGAGWARELRVEKAASEQRIAQVRQGVLVFKLFMGAIVGISLVVGGIGIMNVLLASVYERTREIGIRRTTGARSRDILRQFLAESVVITGAGAAVGAVIGFAAAFGITALIRAFSEAPIHAAFSVTTLAVAMGVSVLVGLAFGTYPARRAARLSPIEAIRHE